MAGGLVNIGMIGGNPLMKAKQVIGEYLPLSKSLDGGAGLGGLMSSVVGGGGLQSIVSNPMGAITGQLQGAIGSAASSLASVQGASGLISALTGAGGLSSATISLLSAGSDLLSGGGIMNLIGHANIADMAGAALPANLGLAMVLGPLNADSVVGQIATWVPAMAAQVQAGTMTVGAATAQVVANTAILNGITSASTTALTTVATMAPDISAVSTIAATFVSAPPEIQAVLERSMDPATAALMRASVATHLDEPNG